MSTPLHAHNNAHTGSPLTRVYAHTYALNSPAPTRHGRLQCRTAVYAGANALREGFEGQGPTQRGADGARILPVRFTFRNRLLSNCLHKRANSGVTLGSWLSGTKKRDLLQTAKSSDFFKQNCLGTSVRRGSGGGRLSWPCEWMLVSLLGCSGCTCEAGTQASGVGQQPSAAMFAM